MVGLPDTYAKNTYWLTSCKGGYINMYNCNIGDIALVIQGYACYVTGKLGEMRNISSYFEEYLSLLKQYDKIFDFDIKEEGKSLRVVVRVGNSARFRSWTLPKKYDVYYMCEDDHSLQSVFCKFVEGFARWMVVDAGIDTTVLYSVYYEAYREYLLRSYYGSVHHYKFS